MPTYRALTKVISYENRFITADNETEARRKADAGEYDNSSLMDTLEHTVETIEEWS